MQQDQKQLRAPPVDDQWTSLAGAVARVAAAYTLSGGAALAVLRQAGISGEVRGRGVYWGVSGALGPDDWRRSEIDPEAGALHLLGVRLGFTRISTVIINTADLDWWLQQRYARLGEDNTAGAGASGIRTIQERSAEEKCREWFATVPPQPRMRKAAARTEAKRQFPQLSENAFSRVWQAEAKKKGWAKPGRPKRADRANAPK